VIDKAVQYAAREKVDGVRFVCGDYRGNSIYREVIVNGGFDYVLYLSVIHYHKLPERQLALDSVGMFTRTGMFFEYAEHHSNGNMNWGKAIVLCSKAGFGSPSILGVSDSGRKVAYFPKESSNGNLESP